MIPLLQGMEQVQYAEEDMPVYENAVYALGETIPPSVARSIGNSLFGFPFPRQSAHHCDDPNVMKIAIVDGGKDKRENEQGGTRMRCKNTSRR